MFKGRPGRRLLKLAIALSLPVALAATVCAQTDEKAMAIAGEVMEALGGEEAWNSTRFIRFTFAGRRTHHWDKWTGRHRLEGTSPEGEHFVVLHNLQDRQGEVWLDGEKVAGEKAEQWLERAYGAWINDTYWLLMPFKLTDPGVILTYQGNETIGEVTYHKLHLRFESVGLTPGDQYWAYIHPETRLMDRWAYHLERMKKDEPPVVWEWQGWQRYGNILLAPERHKVGSDDRLPLTDILVTQEMPDALFASPQPPELP